MATPAKRTLWMRWGQPRAVVAGITALSEASTSMLTDAQLPTYALHEKDVVRALSNQQAIRCEGHEEAQARMEVWKYHRWLLTENGNADRCSLYLSLRTSEDERIQKEIHHLIEGLPQ